MKEWRRTLIINDLERSLQALGHSVFLIKEEDVPAEATVNIEVAKSIVEGEVKKALRGGGCYRIDEAEDNDNQATGRGPQPSEDRGTV